MLLFPRRQGLQKSEKISQVQVGCCNLLVWQFVAFLLLAFDSEGVSVGGRKPSRADPYSSQDIYLVTSACRQDR